MSESMAPTRQKRSTGNRKRALGLRLPGKAARKSVKSPGFRRFDAPAGGTEIANRITLFHDADGGNFACTVSERPWIRLTAYQFSGSYLSLAMALRKADLRQVRPGAVMAVHLDATATRPITAFARLNLRSAEQTETLYETLVLDAAPHDLRFALDGVRMVFSEISAGWLDLIFSDPGMTEIDIRGLSVSFATPGGENG
ncbi:MAG: DUF6478 family protein [Paracoccaceae bacterium]